MGMGMGMGIITHIRTISTATHHTTATVEVADGVEPAGVGEVFMLVKEPELFPALDGPLGGN